MGWISLRPRDRDPLADMLDHAREAHDRIQGVTLEEYLGSRDLQLISERLLAIIGEAANQVSENRRGELALDWRGIRGLRNVISHQYGVVDHVAIYNILVLRLPGLIEAIEGALE